MHLCWDKITKIEYVGAGDIYDLEVPETGNYIAQGIINHNSGKDLTVANLLNYITYWLTSCNDPQKELGLKSGEPIDIVNVSFDKEQAQSVFFEKFTRAIKNTKNPVTGQNYYESIGMNLEEAILKDVVIFPKNIRCFSLNSLESKAEGKNTIIAIFDEIGTFRFDKAEQIRKHIRTTARTTCLKFYKLYYISYLTSANDYMAYLLDKYEKEPAKNVYFDRAATWDVRSAKNCSDGLLKYVVKKEDYQEDFDEDPSSAMLMYECKVPKCKANSFIKRPEKIIACVNMERPSPLIETENLWTYNLMEEEFQPWFRPFYTWEIWQLEKEYEKFPTEELQKRIEIEKERHRNAEYYAHLDLSRGVVDCASVILGHKYQILDKPKIYIDLVIQVKAKKEEESNKEIDMSLILDFIIKRLKKEFKFHLNKLSSDKYNSALFFDLCKKEDIEVELISLEKDSAPYNTAKDFIYREDVNFYMYPPLIREFTELIVLENKKIHHPNKSSWRMKEEAINKGSCDCSDGVAAIIYSATKDDDSEPLGFAGK